MFSRSKFETVALTLVVLALINRSGYGHWISG